MRRSGASWPRRRLGRRSSRPRIVLDPGSHHLFNLGDVAMMEVCLDRLWEMWPEASIQVITSQPDRLAALAPRVRPLSSEARTALTSTEGLDAGWPRRTRERRAPGLRGFRRALTGADLVLIGGRGGMTDAFRDDSLSVLRLLELAADGGATTAMVGQGIGPANDDRLLARASDVLPSVELIALREPLLGPQLLSQLGVPPDRIRVTGDDAVEPAFGLRSPAGPAPGIGVSMRFCSYYGTDASDARTMRAVLSKVAERLGAGFLPLPISLLPGEADSPAIEEMIGVRGDVDTAQEVIRRAGGCRMVVTASYHAGVFALAQGVPVVALGRSSYQRQKLLGLAAQFKAGCTVLSLDDPDLARRLEDGIVAAWRSAPRLRAPLLAAARQQIEAGRAAYGQLAQLVAA